MARPRCARRPRRRARSHIRISPGSSLCDVDRLDPAGRSSHRRHAHLPNVGARPPGRLRSARAGARRARYGGLDWLGRVGHSPIGVVVHEPGQSARLVRVRLPHVLRRRRPAPCFGIMNLATLWLRGFGLTLAIELCIAVPLLAAVEPSRVRRVLAVLIANLATHPLVWFFFTRLGWSWTMVSWVAEAWAFGFEILTYRVIFS